MNAVTASSLNRTLPRTCTAFRAPEARSLSTARGETFRIDATSDLSSNRPISFSPLAVDDGDVPREPYTVRVRRPSFRVRPRLRANSRSGLTREPGGRGGSRPDEDVLLCLLFR